MFFFCDRNTDLVATNTAVGKKQDASTAITTANIGQQSVDYATRAENANNATTATKLGSNAGSTEEPVYFSDGKPIACSSYTLLRRTNPAGSTFLSVNVDNVNYAVPFQDGSRYPITRIGIDKSTNNGKRVLVVQWYADGKMYTNKITCD